MAGDQNERDATGVHLMASAYKRWQNMPPVMLNLSRADAWIVMVGLQTAVAHPLVSGGPMSAAMEEMGRRIQRRSAMIRRSTLWPRAAGTGSTTSSQPMSEQDAPTGPQIPSGEFGDAPAISHSQTPLTK
ncbi:hypothetical protein PV341_29035 [Streptomyces sp. PA03-1a]|nr:hypothetical protein [Streptomyces sp. PA03-1a]